MKDKEVSSVTFNGNRSKLGGREGGQGTKKGTYRCAGNTHNTYICNKKNKIKINSQLH